VLQDAPDHLLVEDEGEYLHRLAAAAAWQGAMLVDAREEHGLMARGEFRAIVCAPNTTI
jgi:hypothetical protein